MARLTCVLQGATICLQGGAASVKRLPLLVKPKTADVFPRLQIFFCFLFLRILHRVLLVNVGTFDDSRKAFYDDDYG